MLFNSIEFLVFLPIVFIIYWRLAKKPLRVQNGFMLLASLTFYGWWDWRFISLILVSTIVDFFCGLAIESASSKQRARKFLLISMCTNLGLLGFFKYFNFFIESWIDVWSQIGVTFNYNTLSIILPVGISFYTFQTMSYTIDIYRGQLKPTRDFISFFTFVSFFPQLVAGPIERASALLPQILTHRVFSYKYAISGINLIIWGLFKKVAVGDNIGIIVDQYYSNVELYSRNIVMSAIAILLYSFQIYCDFSGYSDIAIGTGRLFGIKLNTNFIRPYFSSSFSEFWRRWHISLSTWLRDYLYIPLGGNRHGKINTYINLLITMLLGGLWHGASYNFIFWGFNHGILLGLGRSIQGVRTRLPKFISAMGIFFIVSLVWIPFRSLSLSDTYTVFANSLEPNVSFDLPVSYFDILQSLGLVLVVFTIDLFEELNFRVKTIFFSIIWLILLTYLGNWNAVNFIYFQF